ncbi:hypothetical protein F4820DRAFT_406066 [Hypoxylon rubiginosum]|uniref:Uncharacterized protein n=1 Tax=Hypoxylon rubiginosum TaxID=110542 RepID=A0ACB9ZD87_9PEZI|nr:hypothetical protein F4820DRAFT_406066 [Hypoxylon rubiginosum]
MPYNYSSHSHPANDWSTLGQAYYDSASQWSTKPFYPTGTVPNSPKDEEGDALSGLPTPRVVRTARTATAGSFADYLPTAMPEESRPPFWFDSTGLGLNAARTEERLHPSRRHPSFEAILASTRAQTPALSRETSHHENGRPNSSAARTTAPLPSPYAPVSYALRENAAFFPLSPRPRRTQHHFFRHTTPGSYRNGQRYVGEPSLPGPPSPARGATHSTGLAGADLEEEEEYIPLPSSGSPLVGSRTAWDIEVAGWPPARGQDQNASRGTTAQPRGDDRLRSQTAIPSVEVRDDHNECTHDNSKSEQGSESAQHATSHTDTQRSGRGQHDMEDRDAGLEVLRERTDESSSDSSTIAPIRPTAPAAPAALASQQGLRVPGRSHEYDDNTELAGEEEGVQQEHRRSRQGTEDWAEVVGRIATSTNRLIFVVEGDCHVDLSSPNAVVDEPLVVHVRGDLHIGTAGRVPKNKKRKRDSGSNNDDDEKMNEVGEQEEGESGRPGQRDGEGEDASEEENADGWPAKRRRSPAYTPSSPSPVYLGL